VRIENAFEGRMMDSNKKKQSEKKKNKKKRKRKRKWRIIRAVGGLDFVSPIVLQFVFGKSWPATFSFDCHHLRHPVFFSYRASLRGIWRKVLANALAKVEAGKKIVGYKFFPTATQKTRKRGGARLISKWGRGMAN